MCGFDTQFCENCGYDHHIVKKDIAIKQFLSQCRQELLDEVVKMIEEDIEITKAFANKKQQEGDTKDTTLGYISGRLACDNDILSNLTKLKE